MKLRNKKTGEIVECLAKLSFVERSYNGLSAGKCRCFDSIDLLNAEWEDYEEPKRDYYYIDYNGTIKCFQYWDFDWQEEMKQIGNYFETREEAEKAAEKLKAWKRLKDKGFRFGPWNSRLAGEDHLECCGHINIDASIEPYSDCRQDLDICFGGEK